MLHSPDWTDTTQDDEFWIKFDTVQSRINKHGDAQGTIAQSWINTPAVRQALQHTSNSIQAAETARSARFSTSQGLAEPLIRFKAPFLSDGI